VLVTIDTWRADRFGAGGSPIVRTPHLDRFFRSATQYADAFAPSPTTLASHASLLSGLGPPEHGVPRNGWPLPPDVRTVAQVLSDEGFATGAFVSSAALDPSFGLDRGFDVYDFATPRAVSRDQDWRPASETLLRAGSWWSGQSGRRLLWVHLFEPHFPYDPLPEDRATYAEPYDGPADGSMDFLFSLWEDPARLDPAAFRHLEALYHAEIAGLDRTMGPWLDAWSREPSTVVLVTADHGESLDDHGLFFKHGPLVHPADVQVPLAIGGCAPFGPALSGDLVRTVDLARTVLGRLGVAAELPDGTRDLAVMSAEESAVSEASMPWNVEQEGVYPNAFKQQSIRTRDWAYVETPYLNEKAWYHRASDPGETVPVAGPNPREQGRLIDRLRDAIAVGRERPAPTTVDPLLMERLEALGYTD
jgi:arylsulfatase A-like enzyme